MKPSLPDAKDANTTLGALISDLVPKLDSRAVGGRWGHGRVLK